MSPGSSGGEVKTCIKTASAQIKKHIRKSSYIVGLRPWRMVVGWIQGCPLGVRPIDGLPIKGLGSNRVHEELSTRFKGSHRSSKREDKLRL